LALTVAVPSADSIAAEVGLQPRFRSLPVTVITGEETLSTHVTVLEAETLLPQASATVHILVCERTHPDDCIGPSATVRNGGLHSSLAVADPSAALMFAKLGLQPRLLVVPVAVIPGRTWSTVQVAVRRAVAERQLSVAVKVLVWERSHQEDCIGPSDTVSCTGPQEGSAVAVPSAASMAAELGLHPRLVFVPLMVPIGDDVLSTQVTVLETEVKLPQASVAVHVLVCERLHPIDCIAPSAIVPLIGLQASLANADPSAASMSPELGLQPRSFVVPVVVIPGGVTSTFQTTVLEPVTKSPQASVAVQVLVWE